MTSRVAAALLALATALAGCGLKGPLYLPEKSKEVVVRPAPGAAAGPAAAPEAPPPGPASESSDKPEAPAEPRSDQATPPPGSSHG